MKKISDRIMEYLKGRGFVDKEEVCSQVAYLSHCYNETVGRTLRRLVAEGKVERADYEGKRGTKYRLAQQKDLKPQEDIYETARRLRQEKESNLTFF